MRLTEDMNLRNLLYKNKWTVYQLFKKTEIAQATLFNAFNGQSKIEECRVKQLAKIAEAFGMSIELLKIKSRRGCRYYDCYWCQASSDISVHEVEGIISHEQSEYLRNKYLWGASGRATISVKLDCAQTTGEQKEFLRRSHRVFSCSNKWGS